MTKLIWLMGPSGSGKDSLLETLRQQQQNKLLIAHRYITRAADSGGENHIALSEHEFIQRQQQGLFALNWQAHNQHYGIGVELDIWLAAKFNVVVNGSRQHLTQARERYGKVLLPVCLHVSTKVLRQRLEQRGRESAQQIELRLQRAALYTPDAQDCLVLNNDGSLSETVEQFISLINNQPATKVSATVIHLPPRGPRSV